MKKRYDDYQNDFYKFISLINTYSDMIINPDKNNAYINFKFREVYEFLDNKLNEYVQNNLNHLNDDELNRMTESELRLVEGYPVDEFSKIFYDKVKP